MFQLLSDFPWWAWLLCVLTGAAFAAMLYARDRKLPVSWKPWRYILAAFRFLAITIIAILLLEPYLRSTYNETLKPVAVLVEDNSASIGTALEDTTLWQQAWRELGDKLEGTYDVQRYTFGTQLTADGQADFSAPATDMSAALHSLNQLYRYANVGAVILSGDGIYNTGENPLYTNIDLKAPVFTVALGDTTRQRDLRVSRVLCNNIVFTGDRFVVHAETMALLASGKQMQAYVEEVTENSSVRKAGQTVLISSDQDEPAFDFILQADQPGLHHYRVKLEALDGEQNTVNNSMDFYAEVLNARQKILLIADAAHPDIAAIRSAIDQNKNYDLTVRLSNEYDGDLSGYSLIILHKIPSGTGASNSILKDIQSVKTPLWIITGQLPDWDDLNALQSLVRIRGGSSKGDEVSAVPADGFNLFITEDPVMRSFSGFPPLLAPYGDYSTGTGSQILFRQQLGGARTNNPLWLFSQPGTRKTSVVCGENLWKWRLHDYLENGDHAQFDELIGKTIQYLATKEEEQQFRVSASRNVFREVEPVRLDAELYNEAYELINEPDVACVIRGEDGNEYPFTFSRSGQRYTLDAGYLPPGRYTVQGTTRYNDKPLQDEAAFSVVAVQLETSNTVADHQLLYKLASDHGGQMFRPDQLNALADSLLQSAWAKPTLREKIQTRSVINLRWLLFLIIGLLAVEWFVRKWSGGI